MCEACCGTEHCMDIAKLLAEGESRFINLTFLSHKIAELHTFRDVSFHER